MRHKKQDSRRSTEKEESHHEGHEEESTLRALRALCGALSSILSSLSLRGRGFLFFFLKLGCGWQPELCDVLVSCDEDDSKSEGFASLDDRVEAQSPAPPIDLPIPETTGSMCYIYTSGTTGLPTERICTSGRGRTSY